MDFTYSIVDNIDHIIEEQGTQFTALRKVRWGDSDKAYLELRRWRNTPDGGEQAAKGCTFMTEDGPSTLTETLVEMGYGDTKDILIKLTKRKNFVSAVNSALGKEDENFYNPNDIIDSLESNDNSEDDNNEEYYDPSAVQNALEDSISLAPPKTNEEKFEDIIEGRGL
jgi:hypothetical protein